jgi:hypothetical protein
VHGKSRLWCHRSTKPNWPFQKKTPSRPCPFTKAGTAAGQPGILCAYDGGCHDHSDFLVIFVGCRRALRCQVLQRHIPGVRLYLRRAKPRQRAVKGIGKHPPVSGANDRLLPQITTCPVSRRM